MKRMPKKVSALSLRFSQCNGGEYVWTNEQEQRGAKLGIENDWNSMRNINRTFIRSFIRIQTHTKVFNLLSFFVRNFHLFWHFTRISCFFFALSYCVGLAFCRHFFFFCFIFFHSIPCAQYQWNTIVVAHETPTFWCGSRFQRNFEIVEMFIIVVVVNTQFNSGKKW